jgi:murein DD-endopeptidase MepM/ murein hydrolase activator NlpD
MWNAPRIEISRCGRPPSAEAGCGRPWRSATAVVATMVTAAIVAAFGSLAAPETAHAGEMKPPRLEHINPDWNAVAADLAALLPPAATAKGAPGRIASPIDDLNHATAELFPNIATSAVPVLMPFDTTAYLKDRAAGTAKPRDAYLSGFHLSPFFLPGPSGYDAMFTARASEMPELGINFAGEIDVFVSGFAAIYDLDQPVGMVERPVKAPAPDLLGLRHVLLEDYARNTFERYGVPYVVSILCFDGGVSRYRMITCRDAGKVAERFLDALHMVGGAPAQTTAAPSTIERPEATSPDFTFYSPGDIITGTGFKGKGGHTDYTVYSKMRFPLRDAPAYANSQSFMNWGDCDQTGKVGMGTTAARVPLYRCRIGGPALVKDEAAGGNYAYPWRDNFCEHRYFDVGQCPGGLGHQGQDIRPSSCTQRFEAASCEPYQHEVVAVRDAMVLRQSGTMPVYLFVNAPDEHIRFRYLHMSPKQLDADGVDTGRMLKEGEEFGKVGSYFQHERATTYHLHFDMQVPTKYGWVFINPYMTLVAAYERLIGGRGTEIDEAPQVAVASPPGAVASQSFWPPLPTARPGHVASEGGEDQSHGALDPARPDAAKGVGPRLAAPVAGAGSGADREGTVRSVDRDLSRESNRPGNIRRNVLAGHARPKAGHHSL